MFILIDKPDEEMDSMLSEHIMNLHKKKSENSGNVSNASTFTSQNFCHDSADSGIPLSERLKKRAGERVEAIPHEMLRKYVAYARRYVVPRLTRGACAVLQASLNHSCLFDI